MANSVKVNVRKSTVKISINAKNCNLIWDYEQLNGDYKMQCSSNEEAHQVAERLRTYPREDFVYAHIHGLDVAEMNLEFNN